MTRTALALLLIACGGAQKSEDAVVVAVHDTPDAAPVSTTSMNAEKAPSGEPPPRSYVGVANEDVAEDAFRRIDCA